MASSHAFAPAGNTQTAQQRLPRLDLQVNRGEFIFQQGENCDSLFCVISGRVALTVASESGKEAMVDVLGPGDWFGEQILLRNSKRTITAKALTRTELASFKAESVYSFLEQEPELAVSLMTGALIRLARYEEALFHHLLDNVEHRLAAVLVHLAQQDPTGGGLIPKVSQELLAGMVGTTRSRVNHFMNKFRRLGFIDYRGGCITVKPGLNTLVACGRDRA